MDDQEGGPIEVHSMGLAWVQDSTIGNEVHMATAYLATSQIQQSRRQILTDYYVNIPGQPKVHQVHELSPSFVEGKPPGPIDFLCVRCIAGVGSRADSQGQMPIVSDGHLSMEIPWKSTDIL